MLLIPILAGAIFMFIGLLMLKFPPKKINWYYGYRTSNSMKDQKRWDFAQIYSAKEIIKLGGLLMLSSLIGIFYKFNEHVAIIIGVGLMLTMVVILLYRVERAINKNFNNK